MTISYLLVVAAWLQMASVAWAADSTLIYADQGPSWNEQTRADFYTRDQGSRMIPLAWLQALKQSDGQSFLADNLARYGYLSNPANSNGLPVGFTASGPAGAEFVGMTCSACHTRQIIAEGKTYRIDGGPAIADFQSLLTDLDAALGRVTANDAAFETFAVAVLHSASPAPDDVASLRSDVGAWFQRYHTLMMDALPTPPWGPARLDAVGMIFDRLTGLDLGPPPSYLIEENILKADAPVRYPFIWNAPVQDMTQWPTFAENGNDVLALARNLGEVFGVFGTFEPSSNGLVVHFLNDNSANFDGLGKLENLVKQIGPPKWPWLIDTNLAAQGKTIFERSTDQGGCQECHAIRTGEARSLTPTWSTPVKNVNTDTREYDTLSRPAKTGALQGAFIPLATLPLKDNDLAFNILATSVIGSIAEHFLPGGAPRVPAAVATALGGQIQNVPGLFPLKLTRLPPALRDLERAFRPPVPPPPALPDFQFQGQGIPLPTIASTPLPPKGAYEARVLQGIWAAAPYLHNGSVPTLVELLKPAAERVPQFKVGPAYDTASVGLATDQSQFNYSFVTTDCMALDSGNSRCGHEFGTQLTAPEKKALLEYLKAL